MESNFSQHLRKARKRRGWSQRELVDRLRHFPFSLFVGLDVNALSRWESEKVQPTAERMVQILRVLENSVDELKTCCFPTKPQLIKRFERYRHGNFGLVPLPEGKGKWRRLNEKGSGRQFLRQLCSLTEYERFLNGKESTEQWFVGGSALASLTYRVEGDAFILMHTESLSYSALLSSIERLIELLYASRARLFLMVAPEKKTVKQVRVFQLEEVGASTGVYSAGADYVLGELLTIRSWSHSNRA